jgi:hypothetical protein
MWMVTDADADQSPSHFLLTKETLSLLTHELRGAPRRAHHSSIARAVKS